MLIFKAVKQNHGDSRKLRHTTDKSHGDRHYRRYRKYPPICSDVSAVRCYPKSLILVPIESAHATS